VQYLLDRGAVDASDGSTANFSRMADYPRYISDILQIVKIKTGEEGLEAAAVTMVRFFAEALLEPEETQYRESHADELFKYCIVTTTTQTPLVVFAGQELR
jgi:serine protease inhibitor